MKRKLDGTPTSRIVIGPSPDRPLPSIQSPPVGRIVFTREPAPIVAQYLKYDRGLSLSYQVIDPVYDFNMTHWYHYARIFCYNRNKSDGSIVYTDPIETTGLIQNRKEKWNTTPTNASCELYTSLLSRHNGDFQFSIRVDLKHPDGSHLFGYTKPFYSTSRRNMKTVTKPRPTCQNIAQRLLSVLQYTGTGKSCPCCHVREYETHCESCPFHSKNGLRGKFDTCDNVNLADYLPKTVDTKHIYCIQNI